MTWIKGDVSLSETLTSADHLYETHINQLRVSNPASIVVGMDTNTQYECDGTADDVQIQAAITALTSGGIVFIKKGTYAISAPMTLLSNVKIMGEAGTILSAISPTWNSAYGIFHMLNKNDVTIEGINFSLAGEASAITSAGHNRLRILKCDFTGTTAASEGVLIFEPHTNYSGVPIYNTLIQGCTFHDFQSTARIIRIFPVTSNSVFNTTISNNLFENIKQNCILLDAYYYCRNTNIIGNTFREISGATGSLYGNAVKAFPVNGTYIVGLNINDNQFYNSTAAATGQETSFASVYNSKHINIKGNVAVVLATNAGAFVNIGNLTWPCKYVNIEGNNVAGFDAFLDPDSVYFFNMANNQIVDCGSGISTGYGYHFYHDIHDNVVLNSVNPTYPGGIVIGCGDPVGDTTQKNIKFHDNIIIDDQNPPVMTCAFYFMHNYDYSKNTEIKNNMFYCLYGPVSMVGLHSGSEKLPPIDDSNEINDSNGINHQWIYAQGNVTGATTFNWNKGSIISATLTGNITVTLTAGTHIGQELELRLTQDGTGSRTATWPSTFKKAGGTLTLSTGVSAKDIIKMVWDGTNWNETTRSLNIS